MSKETKTGLFILVFFLALYSFFSIGHFGGDGYQDYLTAESIVLDGNLSLFDRPQDKDDLDYGHAGLGVEGRDGKVYSSRTGGLMPFLLVPFYFMGHLFSMAFKNIPHDYVTMLAVSFANPVISAVNCLMVFLIAGRLGFDKQISLTLSFIYGLATMAPVYARTGFAEPAMVMFMLLTVWFLLKYRISFRVRYLMWAAVLLVCMVFCRPKSVIYVPWFFVYLAWTVKDAALPFSRKARHLFLSLLVFSGILFMLMWGYYYRIYGSMISLGGVNAVAMGKRGLYANHFLKGIYYYLLSTGKSLFIFNLPLVLSLWGLLPALKRNRKESVLFLLVSGVILFYSVKSFRRGSLFCWGPRYFLPSVPLLVFFIGDLIEKYRNAAARICVALVSFAGFLVMLPCMLVNQSKFYLFVVEKLGLEEYMINFIPDLSPVKGAWWMLASNFTRQPLSFVYAPDYKLVEPVSALMDGYNYPDLWFLKTAQLEPAMAPAAYAAAGCLALAALLAAYKIKKQI